MNSGRNSAMTLKNRSTILAIDDEPPILEGISTYFQDSGYIVLKAENGRIGLEVFRREKPDIVLVDLRMPEVDGLEVLATVTQESPDTPIIVVSGTGVIADAVEALRLGAWDYVLKPLHDMAVLEHAVNKALERARLITENKKYQEHLEEEIKKRTAELKRLNVQLQTELAERIRAEETLKASEERYRTIVDTAREGVWVIDKNARTTFANRQMADMLGYSGKEMLGRAVPEFLYDKNAAIFKKKQKTRKKGLGEQYDLRFIRKDGSELWGIVNATPMFDADCQMSGAFAMVTDITERKQAEEALKEAYDIISKSPAVAFLWKNEADWPVEFVSPNVESVFGYTAEEFVLGKIAYSGTVHPDDLDRVAGEIAGYSSEKERLHFTHKPYRIVTKEGKVKWVDDKTYIRRDGKGKITHYQGIVEDITDQVLAQDEKAKLVKQLQQAQKMEALGTLAGGVAHDFNNILGGIIGFTELAQDSLPEDWPAHRDLDKVLNASQRAKELVDHILAFSRQSKTELKPLRISIIVKEALKLLRASLPTTIEIRRNLEADTQIVKADPTQIHQVLMNLCTNAAHAMRDTGGVLEVSLTTLDMDEIMATAHPDLEAGPYLELKVADTGLGMSPEILERIFDPYFTTKEKGEGTGLGLAVVHGIVKIHGGAVTVNSQPEKGTTFHV